MPLFSPLGLLLLDPDYSGLISFGGALPVLVLALLLLGSAVLHARTRKPLFFILYFPLAVLQVVLTLALTAFAEMKLPYLDSLVTGSWLCLAGTLAVHLLVLLDGRKTGP